MGLLDLDDGWEAEDDRPFITDEDEEPWTDADEDALDEYEENKRRKMVEDQEY